MVTPNRNKFIHLSRRPPARTGRLIGTAILGGCYSHIVLYFWSLMRQTAFDECPCESSGLLYCPLLRMDPDCGICGTLCLPDEENNTLITRRTCGVSPRASRGSHRVHRARRNTVSPVLGRHLPPRAEHDSTAHCGGWSDSEAFLTHYPAVHSPEAPSRRGLFVVSPSSGTVATGSICVVGVSQFPANAARESSTEALADLLSPRGTTRAVHVAGADIIGLLSNRVARIAPERRRCRPRRGPHCR